jgi:RNA polymerase sigma-70 factor (ECF subfamily)
MDDTAPTATKAILDRARRGDLDALGTLWADYNPQLIRALRKHALISVEDVASDVWLDVGRGLEHFEGDGDAFRRWLFTIGRRRAIDELRRTARRRVAPRPVPDQTAGLAPAGDESTIATEQLHALLGSLRPATAQAILLHIGLDLSPAQVATLTGRSAANVRMLVHRGLNELRTMPWPTDAEACDRSPEHR